VIIGQQLSQKSLILGRRHLAWVDVNAMEGFVVILVWGFKSYARLLGVLTLVCGNCHNPAAQRLVEVIRKFTLFWIPLFVVKRRTVMTCAFCGTESVLTKDEAAALVAQISAAADPVVTPASQPAAPQSDGTRPTPPPPAPTDETLAP
jgi:hypothetical protein